MRPLEKTSVVCNLFVVIHIQKTTYPLETSLVTVGGALGEKQTSLLAPNPTPAVAQTLGPPKFILQLLLLTLKDEVW